MVKKTIASLLILTLFVFGLTAFAYESAQVTCDVLNVRVSPTTDSEIVTKLMNGEIIEIIYADNGWYNVKLKSGVTGFVSAQYVSILGEPVCSSIAESVANDAYNYIGYSYVYGTNGPDTFDCSGFTSFLYKKYGVYIPRVSTSQGEFGTYVAKEDLIPGDIVCFSSRSDKTINHVGIYVGGGNFIHASTSIRGVVMDSLSSNYYSNHYICARRVV